MSRVKHLLGDILYYEQPTKYIVADTNYNDEYQTPVLTAGKSFILGYTNELEGIYTNLPVIIFDDFTTESKFVDFPFKVKSSAMKLLTVNKEIADIRYMYYLLQTLNVLSNQHKRYWISTYANIEIDLPPLHIQEQIADTLDKADTLRRKDQELLTKYDELAQSIFYDMFGDPKLNEKKWDIITLGDCINYIGDIGSNGANAVVSKNLQMTDIEDYALMIRTTNLSNNDFKNNVKYVSKETYDFFSKSKIYGGEIIMNKIGSAGDFWIMPTLNRPVSLGLNQFVIRLKELNSSYVYAYLSTKYCKAIIKNSLNGAVTKSITKSAVKEIPLIYPPLSLQNKYETILKKIESQKSKLDMFLSKDLFSNLLNKYFS